MRMRMISTMTPIIIIILMFFHQYFLATRVDVLWNESAWKKRNNRSPIKNQRWKKYSDPLLKGGIHRFYPSKCGLVNFGLKTEINAGVELKRSEIIADLCSCSSSQFKTSSYQYRGCQILTRKRNVWNKKDDIWYIKFDQRCNIMSTMTWTMLYTHLRKSTNTIV